MIDKTSHEIEQRRPSQPGRFRRRGRAALLATASALVLAGVVSATLPTSSLFAADGVVSGALSPSATGWIAVDVDLFNSATISAPILDAAGELIVIDVGDGVAPSTGTVDGSLIGAFATGNSAITEINLGAIVLPFDADPPPAMTGQGIGAVILSINEGVVVSSVTTSSLAIDATDFNTGSLQNVDNLITAQTTLNRADTAVYGDVPLGYSSAIPGSIDFDSDNIGTGSNVLETTATVSVSTGQINLPGTFGSNALLDGNSVTLTVTPTIQADVEASLNLDRNTLAANFRGNTASSNVTVENGGNPSFDGSIAVASVQANFQLGVDGTSATNQGSTIAALVGNLDAAIDPDPPLAGNILVGTLSVFGNKISASAAGNEALALEGNQAGNQIVFQSGVNFLGSTGGAAGGGLAYDGGEVVASVDADLALLNHQSNVGTGLSSLTEDASITAMAQGLDQGGITVSKNVIASRTTGNTASNAILVPGEGVGGAFFDGSAAIVSGQVNYVTSVDATTSNAEISTYVGELGDGESVFVEGSAKVDSNTISANAFGNLVTNTLQVNANTVTTGDDDALAWLSGGIQQEGELEGDGGLLLLNVQANFGTGILTQTISATTENAAIDLIVWNLDTPVDGVATIDGSLLSVSKNSIEALAAGSSAGNTLGIGANTLSASAGVGNLQVADDQVGLDAAIWSVVSDATLRIIVGNDDEAMLVSDSKLSLNDNLVRAVAYGTTAANALNVTANTVETPNDSVDPGSTIASLISVDLDATNRLIFDNDPSALPEASAAFVVFNNQNTGTSVAATIDGTEPVAMIYAEADILDSMVYNDHNLLVAAAYGNQSTSELALSVNNLSIGEDTEIDGDSTYSPVANVTNLQTMSEGSEVHALIDLDGLALATIIDGNVDGSDVDGSIISLSDSLVQAAAYGNRASSGGPNPYGNLLTVTGNNITAVPSGDEGPLGGMTMAFDLAGNTFDMSADAAFTVQNAQSGADSVTATLAGTDALLQIVGDVSSARLAMDRNTFLTTAMNNQAVNELGVSANLFQASTGIQSFQLTSSDTIATTGIPGTPPTPPTDAQPFSVDVTLTTLNSTCTLGDCTIEVGTEVTIDTTGLTSDQIDVLVGLGWTTSGPNQLSSTNLSLITSLLGFSSYAEGSLISGSQVIADAEIPADPGSSGVPASPSVIIAIGGASGDIIDSAVSIDGTQTFATAIANDVVNALRVSATNIVGAAGLGLGDSEASIEFDGPADEILHAAVADHAISNLQVLDAGGQTIAEAFSTQAIRIDDPSGAGFTEIAGSGLSIENSVQQALAIGNRATTILSLTAEANIGSEGAEGATSALLTMQSGIDVTVSARSEAEFFAPGAMQSSTLSISDNINSSVATVNQASNTSTVSGTNVASVAGTPVNAVATVQDDLGVPTGLMAASASHTLLNVQGSNENTVTSTAVTSIFNQEFGGATPFGLDTSKVSLNNNYTEARATMNDASNSLTIQGGATLSATGALTNVQGSAGGSATAEATGTIQYLLNGDNTPASANSSISASNNTVVAAARGNTATNVLNATAGAAYTGLPTTGASTSVSDPGGPTQSLVASASYAVLNSQTNTSDLTARVTGGVSVSLAGGNGVTSSASSVSVMGNRFEASAIGNSATNVLTSSALGTGMPSMALTSVQRNTGNAITAEATGVRIGVTLVGIGSTGGTSAISGNSISASATGNSVVNRIGFSN